MLSDKLNFTLLDHTADLGIIVQGRDLKSLFEDSARALLKIMVKCKSAHKTNTVKLSLTSEDLADLMVNWLGEILYLFEGEKEIVSQVKVNSLSSSHLDATLETVHLDPERHKILCEIKAVTYHQIQVIEKGDHWEARVIFDI